MIKLVKKHGKIAVCFNNKEIHLSIGAGEVLINVSDDLLGFAMSDIEVVEVLREIFEDESVIKILFDSKQTMYYLKKYGIKLFNYFDCSIAKYLVDGVPVDSIKDIFLNTTSQERIPPSYKLSKKLAYPTLI